MAAGRRPDYEFDLFPPKRGGVTIVELLVVITLLLIVTAVTVPVLAPAVQQRRVREATRLVSSYIAAARSRAMEIGRPVAVVIERFNPGLSSATTSVAQSAAASPAYQPFSMNLSIAESPPPYAGDFSGSLVNVSYSGSGNNLTLNSFVSTDSYQNQQINIGDRIRLNYQGPLYSITTTQVGTNGYINGVPWTLMPVSSSDVTLPINMIAYPPAMWSASGVNLPFEIFRQPFRSAAIAPLQLPEGIVIDLNYSGMGGTTTGVFFDASINQIISFAPGGGIDSVYDATSSNPSVATDQHPVGPIFLLLGRREQVSFGGYTPTGTPYASNLADPNSFWVSIGYQSGQVTTNENYASSGNAVTVPIARSLATGSVGSITTTGGN